MTTQRGEIHDELRAVIAAGRELSPEDDGLLADMFLDKLARSVEQPHVRRSRSRPPVRRFAGAAMLALALLSGTALLSVRGSHHQGQSSFVQPVGMKAGPNLKVFPGPAPGKIQVVPAIPAPKGAPLQPKG